MLTPYYEGPAKDRGSMQDQADMVTNSSDVEVCLEEPPGSACTMVGCRQVSTIFSTFSVDIQVNFCLICIQLLAESNERHGIP